MSDLFYKAFEDRYRGSREVVMTRLSAYQPFLEPLARLEQPVALDLGCGRGEWLELTAAMGFAATGVDLDDGMLSACRERGLDARHDDALAALRACADASVALVSAFHLVEHLPFELVRELVGEALRVLRPGGLLIMETPNPENLVVGATSFYLDPSHLHPLPPPLLDFVTGFAGFARHKVVRLQENARARSGGRPRLIDVLEGSSTDYAVVAQKTGAPALLAGLDAPFAQDYGITLAVMAERYDDESERARQLDRQDDLAYVQRVAAELRAGTDSLRQHVDLAVAARLQQQVEDLAGRQRELERRANEQAVHGAELLRQLAELNRRTGEAEQRAAAYQQRILDMTASTSWRVTAPLRWGGHQVHRARAAVREGRVVPGLKRRALPLVLAAMRAVMRRPRVKQAARGLLRRFPGLQARLHGILTRSAVQAMQTAPPAATPQQQPGALSPRAQRIFEQLKQELDARNG